MGFGGFLKGLARTATSFIPGNVDDFIVNTAINKLSPAAPSQTATGCGPGYTMRNGQCVSSRYGYEGPTRQGPRGPVYDPTPRTTTPAERSMGQRGPAAPMRSSREFYDCPEFADGKKGILWMDSWTGELVCLPRGTNGKKYGLQRKNKPRAKPYVSAHDKKMLTKYGKGGSTAKKAKEFAKLAGFHTHAGHKRGR